MDSNSKTGRYSTPGQWPKPMPQLTDEQRRIQDDFHVAWLEALPQRYGLIERFNHTYPLRALKKPFCKTLDIGAGRGEHLHYEDLSNQEYVALDVNPELVTRTQKAFPSVRVVLGDVHQRQDFPDGYFDRVMAIHVLEHLPDLPRALDEIRRVLSPEGQFAVMIPCDPGIAYETARNISARRLFEKRYNQSYDWFLACEHINRPNEIMGELRKRFRIVHRTFFPFLIPSVNLNLVIGMTLRPLP